MVKFCGGCNNRQCFSSDNNTDPFIVTYRCLECGYVYDNGDSPPDDGLDGSLVPGDSGPRMPVPPVFKNTYQRVAHLNERLSSAMLKEPLPPTAVIDLIHQQWMAIQETNFFVRLRATQGICKKSDIRLVLGSLDCSPVARARLVEARVTQIDPSPNPDTGFSILYLEKWKHLAHILTGKTPPLYSELQMVKVGSLLTKFSGVWNRYQHPADKQERKYWVFKERKHFPNFNFMFQRVHELLGKEYTKFNSEFPLPTNSQALKKLWTYWRFIAKKANVPFRGKDHGNGYTETEYKQTVLTNYIQTNAQERDSSSQV